MTLVSPVADLLMARGVPLVLSSGHETVPPAYAHLPRQQKPVSTRLLLRAVTRSIGAS